MSSKEINNYWLREEERVYELCDEEKYSAECWYSARVVTQNKADHRRGSGWNEEKAISWLMVVEKQKRG